MIIMVITDHDHHGNHGIMIILGSWLVSNFDMLSHFNNIWSSSFYYIYNIRRIRKYLSRQTAISVIHAFITSKLDYRNSLLYGLPTIHINKLQRVQNAAAKLVTTCNTPLICHITLVLKGVHLSLIHI